jgi:uncharacterized repeat protein (TIGR01451 family)
VDPGYTDTSFMRLANLPPEGTFFAGWDAGSVPALNDPVTGLHDPEGDLLKISEGTVHDYVSCTSPQFGGFSCDPSTAASSTYFDVHWTSGLSEPGSSGSGLFDDGGFLVGQLYGGIGDCTAPGDTYYGRFDVAYDAQVKRWLSAPAGSVDLAIAQTPNPSTAGAGKDEMLTLVAANNGGHEATSVTVTDTLPAGSTFVWASPACPQASGVVTCTAASIASGASASFEVVMRPAAAGTITNAVSASAAEADAWADDNASSLDITVNATPAGVPVTRYRLYSPVTQEHLFTTDLNEYDTLGAETGVWNQEGASGRVLDNPGLFNGVTAEPYYRLYNTITRWHHWTTDANEYYTLIQFPNWNAEGVDGYILPSDTTGAEQLFRLVYPDGRGLHHWTIDSVEYGILTTQYGWIGEGGAGFVIQ